MSAGERLSIDADAGDLWRAQYSSESQSKSTMATEIRTKTANHLVMFVHGHNGHPDELNYVSSQLQQMYPERVITRLAMSFDGQTNTGVDKIGRLVASETQEYVSTLLQEGISVKYISFVGYSLGGVVSRYAIGILYSKHFFDHIKPVNFTTFASPHAGIIKPVAGLSLDSVHNTIFNFVVSSSVSGATAAQLTFQDDYEGRPLLIAMTEENSDYIQALRLFPHRSLYANVTLDYLVPYYTAAISLNDFPTGAYPFVVGCEPVIFDVINRTPSDSENGVSTASAVGQLNLLGSQKSVINALNSVGWNKYPVQIHNYRNTHTAILVFKVRNPDTCEGRVVVCHYKDHFVVLNDEE